MSLSAAEQKVRKLARLASNTVCANCGTTKKFGFSTVCIKYFTFVCSNCKSSHQAISHRCKSLTMSSWTDSEVEELQRKGNDFARRTWLKNAPPPGSNGRPKEGDHIDVFKRFVVDAYERKRYYGEDDGQQKQQQPKQAVATAVPLSQSSVGGFAVPTSTAQKQLPPVRKAATAPTRAAPAPAPAPVADLLDFSTAAPQPAPSTATFEANFDAFQSTPAPSSQPKPANNVFQADFANFPTKSDPFSAPAPAPAATTSAFGFISPPPSAAPTPAPSTSSSSFGFISPPPAAAKPAPVPSAPSSDFADFSALSLQDSSTTSTQSTQPTLATLQTSEQKKKPIMSSQLGNSDKGSLISAMNMSSGTPQQQFGNSMQQNSFGMTPQKMMMSQQNFGMQQQQQQQQQQMMMMQQQQRMMQQNMMGMNNNYMGMNAGYNNSMNPQAMMNFGQSNPSSTGSNNGMHSLQMNASSMNAWTTGGGANAKK